MRHGLFCFFGYGTLKGVEHTKSHMCGVQVNDGVQVKHGEEQFNHPAFSMKN